MDTRTEEFNRREMRLGIILFVAMALIGGAVCAWVVFQHAAQQEHRPPVPVNN